MTYFQCLRYKYIQQKHTNHNKQPLKRVSLDKQRTFCTHEICFKILFHTALYKWPAAATRFNGLVSQGADTAVTSDKVSDSLVSQGADTVVTSDKVSDSLVSQGADTAVTSDKVSDRPTS